MRRVLRLKARLGLFDDASRGQSGGGAKLDVEDCRSLARDAARRSIVLLQNRNGVLPFSGDGKRLAIIGPLADDRDNVLGPWRAVARPENTTSFLSAMTEAMPGWQIAHERGCHILEEDADGLVAALEAAKKRRYRAAMPW